MALPLPLVRGIGRLDWRLARRAPLLDAAAPPREGGLGRLPWHDPESANPEDASPGGSSSTAWALEIAQRLQARRPELAAPFHALDARLVTRQQRRIARHGWLASLAWLGATGR